MNHPKRTLPMCFHTTRRGDRKARGFAPGAGVYGPVLAAALSLLVAAGAPGPTAAAAGDLPGDANAPSVPEDNVCGLNSLYMFLRLRGHSIPPDEVRNKTPRGELGSSLQELKDAAGGLGVEVRVYRCGVEDLGRSCDLPAIAHMKNSARLSAGSRRYAGHFVLVCSVEPGPSGLVHWYDGTLGTPFNRPKAEFVKMWTGHVLSCPQRDGVDRLVVWGTMVHTVAWGAALLGLGSRFLRARTRTRLPAELPA
jgi:hypothetical protein